MPIIAQFMFGAEFKEDGIVEILRDEIIESGCVSLQSGAERFKVSIDRVRSIFQEMNGVTCDEEKCCVTDMTAFSANMKKLAGGE
jgi:hypothetical protein